MSGIRELKCKGDKMIELGNVIGRRGIGECWRFIKGWELVVKVV